jgi:hypothetical protein
VAVVHETLLTLVALLPKRHSWPWLLSRSQRMCGLLSLPTASARPAPRTQSHPHTSDPSARLAAASCTGTHARMPGPARALDRGRDRTLSSACRSARPGLPKRDGRRRIPRPLLLLMMMRARRRPRAGCMCCVAALCTGRRARRRLPRSRRGSHSPESPPRTRTGSSGS